MNVGYNTWIFMIHKFSMQYLVAFIGQVVYPVGGKVDGVTEGVRRDHYFSQLQSSLYYST